LREEWEGILPLAGGGAKRNYISRENQKFRSQARPSRPEGSRGKDVDTHLDKVLGRRKEKGKKGAYLPDLKKGENFRLERENDD